MPSLGDTLFAFTDWLRSTPLVDFALWISNTSTSLWIGTHFWAIPILQTLHILSIAMAFGSVLLINLRILGLTGGSRTIEQTVHRYLPWIWWALVVLIVTGFGMIIGEPVRELINPVFWIKMALVIAMILLSIGFQTMARRNAARWEMTGAGQISLRTGAVCIILLWCAIMVAGRWIAYAPV